MIIHIILGLIYFAGIATRAYMAFDIKILFTNYIVTLGLTLI
jgi:hypothetical protein